MWWDFLKQLIGTLINLVLTKEALILIGIFIALKLIMIKVQQKRGKFHAR